MQVQSDFLLKHQLWFEAEEKLINRKIFTRMIDLFIVCCSLGIKDDSIIDLDDTIQKPKQIGRNTYIGQNEDLSRIITFLFQNAILNSTTVDFTAKERLRLAFDPDFPTDKDKMNLSPTNFLIKFANYGLSKIMQCYDPQDIIFTDNIKEMLDEHIKGVNINDYIAENVDN